MLSSGRNSCKICRYDVYFMGNGQVLHRSAFRRSIEMKHGPLGSLYLRCLGRARLSFGAERVGPLQDFQAGQSRKTTSGASDVGL
jgi:hypothetical protein